MRFLFFQKFGFKGLKAWVLVSLCVIENCIHSILCLLIRTDHTEHGKKFLHSAMMPSPVCMIMEETWDCKLFKEVMGRRERSLYICEALWNFSLLCK